MANIKSKNTSIEMLVFSKLRKTGIYFQRHYRKIPGNPDIAIPSKQKAVFIDGDFWHGYRFTSFRKRLPSFWKNKIENNMKRDVKNRSKLYRSGWKVLRVWEHQIERHEDETIHKIRAFLR
jgi:DNA mismatch endonuclease, patch repair protein